MQHKTNFVRFIKFRQIQKISVPPDLRKLLFMRLTAELSSQLSDYLSGPQSVHVGFDVFPVKLIRCSVSVARTTASVHSCSRTEVELLLLPANKYGAKKSTLTSNVPAFNCWRFSSEVWTIWPSIGQNMSACLWLPCFNVIPGMSLITRLGLWMLSQHMAYTPPWGHNAVTTPPVDKNHWHNHYKKNDDLGWPWTAVSSNFRRSVKQQLLNE